MNRSTLKVRKRRVVNWPQARWSWWPFSRNKEGRRLGGLVKKSFVEVLGNLGWCRHRESGFWAVEWQDGEGVLEKEVFIGQNGQGQIWLISCRIREIRGYSSGYGNCSHSNQGIAQVIWQQVVIIWRYFTVQDLLVGPSAVLSNSNIADGRIKWRNSVREVEEFEEYARKSGRGSYGLTNGYQIGRINCGKASLLWRILEH